MLEFFFEVSSYSKKLLSILHRELSYSHEDFHSSINVCAVILDLFCVFCWFDNYLHSPINLLSVWYYWSKSGIFNLVYLMSHIIQCMLRRQKTLIEILCYFCILEYWHVIKVCYFYHWKICFIASNLDNVKWRNAKKL